MGKMGDFGDNWNMANGVGRAGADEISIFGGMGGVKMLAAANGSRRDSENGEKRKI
jgi:hypothetical protein